MRADQEHRLHCTHLVTSQAGTFTAMPRFSYLVVPVGITPSAAIAETGSLSPS